MDRTGINHRRTDRAIRVDEAPGGLRSLFERAAAALGNGDDLVDDRRGWLAARKAAADRDRGA